MCSSNYILMMVLSSWIHSLIKLHAYLSVRVSYRIDCLFKLYDEIIFSMDSCLFIMIISPRILRILTGYYDRQCNSSFVVRSSFVRRRRWCNAFSLSPHDFSERLKIWNFDENKTLNVFEQLHINDGTLFLNTLSYNITRIF